MPGHRRTPRSAHQVLKDRRRRAPSLSSQGSEAQADEEAVQADDPVAVDTADAAAEPIQAYSVPVVPRSTCGACVAGGAAAAGAPHDHAHALCLCCIDYRITSGVVDTLTDKRGKTFDFFSMAGDALFVVRPEYPERAATFLQNLLISRDFHGSDEVVLTSHSECGAYKAIYPQLVPLYATDPVAAAALERKLHVKNAKKLRKVVRQTHPEMRFRAYYWLTDQGILERLF
jgi:hypothetical protein